jgi:streptomycin 6-kinase
MSITTVAIPEALARNTVDINGEAGVGWLRRLPNLLEECAREWRLEIGPPYGELSYNYVAPVTRADGTEAVLKVGFSTSQFLGEMETMRLFDGRGSARLLAANPERGVLLLERVRPGISLAARADLTQEEAADIAAGVMRRLWRTPPGGDAFRPVDEWLSGMAERAPKLLTDTPDFPTHWLERAQALYARLAATAGPTVVLHGDLHHGNILQGGREPWLAIDGWGILGEAAWEPGPFFLNALPNPWAEGAAGTLSACLRRFATLNEMDANRVRDCGVVRAVVSAFWSLEDHGADWDAAIRCAALLDALR